MLGNEVRRREIKKICTEKKERNSRRLTCTYARTQVNTRFSEYTLTSVNADGTAINSTKMPAALDLLHAQVKSQIRRRAFIVYTYTKVIVKIWHIDKCVCV